MRPPSPLNPARQMAYNAGDTDLYRQIFPEHLLPEGAPR